MGDPRGCRQGEGCTGIDCALPDAHQGDHEGSTTVMQTEYVGYPLFVRWPRDRTDTCNPAEVPQWERDLLDKQDSRVGKPVVDSELRDQVAQALHYAQCAGSDTDAWDCGNPAHWQDWRELADRAVDPVTPVLAAKDRLIAQSDEQWEQAEAELQRERDRHAERDEINAGWVKYRDRKIRERREHQAALADALGLPDDERERRFESIPAMVEAVAAMRAERDEAREQRDMAIAGEEFAAKHLEPWKQKVEELHAERDELRAHGVARDIGEANDRTLAGCLAHGVHPHGGHECDECQECTQGPVAPATPTEPRVWSVSDVEPAGVTAVTTPGGAVFNRSDDRRWRSESVMHGHAFTWSDLVNGYPFMTEVVEDGAT